MSTPAPNGTLAPNAAASGSTMPAPPPAPKSKAPVVVPGIYPVDSIRMAAESIGLSNLDESVALGLAGDVEFRLHQVIEEAQKFMRHSRRTTMTPADINNALAALSIEPIYGHLPLPSSTPHFLPLKLPPNLSGPSTSSKSSKLAPSTSAASASQGASDIYFLADPEVDFAKMLAAPPPGLVGGGVTWKAHWLAVEGVMPRVPENVAPNQAAYRQAAAGGGGSAAAGAYLANGGGSSAGGSASAQAGGSGKGGKPALSQELQLYFSRLTAALLPTPEARTGAPASAGGRGELGESERARLAALASLRGDTGLQGLVVYLVRWLGEKVAQNLGHLQELTYLLEAVNALILNQTLFLEPFLHQILPITLSPLLTSPLGSALPVEGKKRSASVEPTTTEVRQLAAEVLCVVVHEYAGVYETLIPRLTKTLLRSLPRPHPAGRVEGALLGLASLGRHAVWRALWGGESEASAGRGRKSKKRAVATAAGGAEAAEDGELKGAARLKAWADEWTTVPGWTSEDKTTVVAAAVSIIPKLLPVTRPKTTPLVPVTDPSTLAMLEQTFGSPLAHFIQQDASLADGLLQLSPDEEPKEQEQAPETVIKERPLDFGAAEEDVTMAEASPAPGDAQAAPTPASEVAGAGAEQLPVKVEPAGDSGPLAAARDGDEEEEDEDMEAVP